MNIHISHSGGLINPSIIREIYSDKRKMLLKESYKCDDGSVQMCFATYHCKYCGKLFIKFENKKMYCSPECAHKSTQDNKARYQRKRRKLIRTGELISNENTKLGTFHFPKTIKNWTDELKRLQYAKRKAGII